MRTPRAVSFLALSGLLLLLAVSVAATGYGGDGANSPGGNGYAGGHDAAAGSKGYGSGGASPGEKGYAGGGGQEGSYKVPAYQESVAGLDESTTRSRAQKWRKSSGRL
jgi:peroxidase